MPDLPTRSARRPQRARIELPHSPSSVGTARRFIEARTSAWSLPERTGEQLVLIGSELVTNAVLHARTDLTLTLELRDGRARITVKDQSRAPATLRQYRTDALTGRGLGVVAALSDSWGISAAADGKVVWAKVAAGGDAAGGAPRPPELGQLPAPAAAEAPGTRPVRFPGVPVEGYLELLKRADELCRAGVLLTPEPPAPVRALRRWFVDQMVGQLQGGAAPTPPGDSVGG